jgi:hypothetical protein
MKEALTPLDQLKSVLCDPEGKCCIAGSAEDRAVVDRALQALAQPPLPVQEPHNFCPRCAKRLWGVLGQPQVHTCTPPLWGYK